MKYTKNQLQAIKYYQEMNKSKQQAEVFWRKFTKTFSRLSNLEQAQVAGKCK